jgi:hypothetical protein
MFDMAFDRGYSLTNTSRLYTFFPYDHTKRSSTLDLAFPNIPFSKFHTSWNNDTSPTGSNHMAPYTHIYLNFTIPPFTLLDWNNITWPTAKNALENLLIPDFHLHNNLNSWFEYSYNLVTSTLSAQTTTCRPFSWSKKWWSPDLSEK